jgi:hypothetical protein
MSADLTGRDVDAEIELTEGGAGPAAGQCRPSILATRRRGHQGHGLSKQRFCGYSRR